MVHSILREKLKDPAVYSKSDAHWAGPDNVRAKVFEAFGLFVTESSKHMSEYVPYFRKRPELFNQFNLLSNIEYRNHCFRKIGCESISDYIHSLNTRNIRLLYVCDKLTMKEKMQ
jgi:hypothetical protein